MDYRQAVLAGISAGVLSAYRGLEAKYGPKIRANLPRYGTVLGRFVGRLLHRKRRQGDSA